MVLQSSGVISLDDIQGEFGGNNPISLSEYYAAASGVPASGTIKFSDFYGRSNIINLTITENQADLNLANYLRDNFGWDRGPATIIIPSNIWLYSNNTSNAGLIINGEFDGGLEIYNYGKIIGKGGNGGDTNDDRVPNKANNGGNGGPAISIASSNVVIYNLAGAFIAGGGGGGGGGNAFSKAGGGGGAGGGTGGRGLSTGNVLLAGGAGGGLGGSGANSQVGGNNTTGQGGNAGGSAGGTNENGGSDDESGSGGGGGGRVLPGNGVNALIPTGNQADWPGGYGGGVLNGVPQRGGDFGYPYWQNPTATGGTGRRNVGGGGGAWGQGGGNGAGGNGGAGGAAISASVSYTLNSSGTIYGTT